MKPVFILGILERSGTNYLQHIISKHPGCRICAPPWEDHLLENAHYLDQYANGVISYYKEEWRNHDTTKKELLTKIGQGLLQFIQPDDQEAEFSITKTPSTQNIHHFFNLFPQGYLIVLVRDGKDLAESYVSTFGVNYDEAFQRWTQSANRILRFRDWSEQNGYTFHMVRYEDLFLNVEEELRNIFHYIGVDADNYDYQDAVNAEVIGSSTYKGGHQSTYFGKLKKDESFNPLKKWDKWTDRLHSRFNWICGETAQKLGYPIELDTNSLYYKAYNKTKDVLYKS